MKYTHHYVVDRATWLHGGLLDIVGNSVLLEPYTGLMCCLGQFCQQLRIPKRAIEAKATPDELRGEGWDARLVKGALLRKDDNRVGHSKFAVEAMTINDNATIDNKTRERKLKALGAQHGIKITFLGRYANRDKVQEAWDK